MSPVTASDRLIAAVSRGIDRTVHVRLTTVEVGRPETIDLRPVDAGSFWEASTVRRPRPVWVANEWSPFEGPAWRELELEGESEGPGDRRLLATAHVRPGVRDAPAVLLIHGYAIPFTGYDRWLAWRMRRRGAQTVRLDLPMHLRRTAPGKRSGDGFFSADPAHIRAVVRQAVEDAAAVVEWTRREVSPVVTVVGVSLGGLIATLLAAETRLDGAVAIVPFCDPAASMADRTPWVSQRHIGVVGSGDAYWGDNRRRVRSTLEASLAPIIARNLVPRTEPASITLVRAMSDLVVGHEPVAALAAAWGAELWTYPHGHITVMNAPGIARRVTDRATGTSPAGGLRRAG